MGNIDLERTLGTINGAHSQRLALEVVAAVVVVVLRDAVRGGAAGASVAGESDCGALHAVALGVLVDGWEDT